MAYLNKNKKKKYKMKNSEIRKLITKNKNKMDKQTTEYKKE